MSVFLEGNVIDLGTYRLQVVEACSGLNYMFPLMTIGLLFVYVYQAPLLARLLIFALTVPISVLMNSVRIAAIGILVNHKGIGAAEGFMHYFEGWVVFLLCLFLLLLAAKLINALLRIDRPLLDTIDLYAVPTDVVIRPADDQFLMDAGSLDSCTYCQSISIFWHIDASGRGRFTKKQLFKFSVHYEWMDGEELLLRK